MYYDQCRFENDYCCEDCKEEAEHWVALEYQNRSMLLKEVTKEYNAIYGRFGIAKRKSYPHCFLPINLLV